MGRIINEDIGGLIWYAECMNRALKQIQAFTPPAQDIRFYHSLFVVNFMSLLERATEIFGDNLKREWILRLDGVGGYTSNNNEAYLRELRNAAVHRGFDIASSGSVILNHVQAIAPSEVIDRSGKKGPFKAFANTLFELFSISRAIAGPLILEFAEPLVQIVEAMDLEAIQADYVRDVEASGLMPEWAKKMACEGVDQVPFDEIRALQSSKLRSLLS